MTAQLRTGGKSIALKVKPSATGRCGHQHFTLLEQLNPLAIQQVGLQTRPRGGRRGLKQLWIELGRLRPQFAPPEAAHHEVWCRIRGVLLSQPSGDHAHTCRCISGIYRLRCERSVWRERRSVGRLRHFFDWVGIDLKFQRELVPQVALGGFKSASQRRERRAAGAEARIGGLLKPREKCPAVGEVGQGNADGHFPRRVDRRAHVFGSGPTFFHRHCPGSAFLVIVGRLRLRRDALRRVQILKRKSPDDRRESNRNDEILANPVERPESKFEIVVLGQRIDRLPVLVNQPLHHRQTGGKTGKALPSQQSFGQPRGELQILGFLREQLRGAGDDRVPIGRLAIGARQVFLATRLLDRVEARVVAKISSRRCLPGDRLQTKSNQLGVCRHETIPTKERKTADRSGWRGNAEVADFEERHMASIHDQQLLANGCKLAVGQLNPIRRTAESKVIIGFPPRRRCDGRQDDLAKFLISHRRPQAQSRRRPVQITETRGGRHNNRCEVSEGQPQVAPPRHDFQSSAYARVSISN